MPTYEENLKHAQHILQEIQRRNIGRPEDDKGAPVKIIWGKLNFIRQQVKKKIEGEINLLLPGLTFAITSTNLNVGACQELCQLASLLSLAANRLDIVLVTLGNQKEIQSGNHHANNHMIVMLGPVSYPEEMVYASHKARDMKAQTLDDFFERQPESVVVLDLLLNFAGRPADCPSLRQYCTSHNIPDAMGVVPYQYTLAGIKFSNKEIVRIVEKNATRIADEISRELNQSLMQGAKKNETAEFMLKMLLNKPNSKVDNVVDPEGMNLLHYGCLYGNQILADYYSKICPGLWDLPNRDGRTPLDCLGASLDKIKETLRSAGLSPSDQDVKTIADNVRTLKTALLKKGHHSDWLLRKSACDGDLESVRCLANLKSEAINNFGLPSKATALHQAARQGRVGICSFLMGMKGIIIDPVDVNGNTPFLLAIKGKHFNLVPIFVGAKADVDKKNENGESVRSLLASLGQESLLAVGSEAPEGIVSAAKNLMHFSPPAKSSAPAATGQAPELNLTFHQLLPEN